MQPNAGSLVTLMCLQTEKAMIIRFRYLLPFFLAVILLAGCSNKSLKPEVTDVGEHPETTSIKILPKPVLDFIDPRAYDLYVNGLIYEEIGDLRAAVQSYTDALQFYPNSYEIRYSLGAAYYQVRQYHDAIAVLDVIEPEDADVYTLRGASYLALGLVDSAKIAFTELVHIDPENTMGYSYLAGIYRQQADLDSLIWSYEHLTRLRPDNERQWRELGRLQVEAGDYEEARNSFQQSLNQVNDATNILSYVGLAELLQEEGQIDSALSVYKAAIHLDPDNVVLNRELAIAYYQMDSTAEAVPYAKHLVELSPDDRTAIRRLAMIYMGTDSLKSADSLFNILSLGDKNPIYYYFLGQIATKEKRFQDAVNRFTTFTQLVDTASEGWMALAYSYQQLKQYEDEITALKSGLGHVSGDEETLNLLFSLGAAYEQAGQVAQAESTFEEIIARSPDFAPALNYLGYMLADRGERLDYAKQLIERAVKITPDNAAYLDSYGWVLYRLGDYRQALKQFQKAVSLDSDPTIFDHLGDTYKALGNLSDARAWWQKALDLSPDDTQIKEKLGN